MDVKLEWKYFAYCAGLFHYWAWDEAAHKGHWITMDGEVHGSSLDISDWTRDPEITCPFIDADMVMDEGL